MLIVSGIVKPQKSNELKSRILQRMEDMRQQQPAHNSKDKNSDNYDNNGDKT